VINTILPSILHRFQVIADYVKFSLATGGRFTLTPSLGAIPCEYRRHK